jgi:hypothetical protein
MCSEENESLRSYKKHTPLSTPRDGLTCTTLNFVPEGDVIRKEFGFADRENSRNFYDGQREKVYL